MSSSAPRPASATSASCRPTSISARRCSRPRSAARAPSSGIDPTIGFSLHYDINEKWYLNVIADVGGFGVFRSSPRRALPRSATCGRPSISSAIGYRAIYTDYEDGGFVYDVTQHGVFTSIAHHFLERRLSALAQPLPASRPIHSAVASSIAFRSYKCLLTT